MSFTKEKTQERGQGVLKDKTKKGKEGYKKQTTKRKNFNRQLWSCHCLLKEFGCFLWVLPRNCADLFVLCPHLVLVTGGQFCGGCNFSDFLGNLVKRNSSL